MGTLYTRMLRESNYGICLRSLRIVAQMYHPARTPYLRTYPADTIWRGYLSAIAIEELELAGNTVRWHDDHYVLNSTSPRDLSTVTVVATAEPWRPAEVI